MWDSLAVMYAQRRISTAIQAAPATMKGTRTSQPEVPPRELPKRARILANTARNTAYEMKPRAANLIAAPSDPLRAHSTMATTIEPTRYMPMMPAVSTLSPAVRANGRLAPTAIISVRRWPLEMGGTTSTLRPMAQIATTMAAGRTVERMRAAVPAANDAAVPIKIASPMMIRLCNWFALLWDHRGNRGGNTRTAIDLARSLQRRH